MTDQAATKHAASPAKKKSRWPKKTLIAIAIIGGILVGLPYAIGYAIKSALINAGAESAHVEDIDFNMFSGDLKVRRLHVKVPELPEVVLDTAYVDLDWSALLNKHIVIDQLNIHDVDIRIERNADGSMNVIGLQVLSASDPNATPVEEQGGTIPFIDGAGIALFELLDINLVYVDPSIDLTLRIDSLTVQSVYSWEADSAAELEFKGSLNGSPITIVAKVKAFGDSQSADVHIKVDSLDLNAFEKIAGEAIPTLAGIFGIDTQLKVTYQQDLLSVYNEGNVNISGLHVAFDGGELQDDNLNWQGKLALSLPLAQTSTDASTGEATEEGAAAAGPTFKDEGKLVSRGLKLSLTEPALTLNSEKLDWNGIVSQGAEGISSLAVEGSATITNTSIKMAGEQPLSVALASLQLSDLLMGGTDNIKVGGLKLSKITVEMAGEQPLTAALANVSVTELSVAGTDNIKVSGVKLSEITVEMAGEQPLTAALANISVSELSVAGSDNIKVGGLNLSEISVAMTGEQPLTAALDTLKVSHLSVSDTDNIKIGDLALSKITVEMTGETALKSSIDAITSKHFSMAGPEQIAIGTVTVSGIVTTIPGDKPMSATLESLSSSDLKINNSDQISAAGLELKGARITDSSAKLDLAVIAAVAISQIDIKGADSIQLGSIKATGIQGLVGSGGKGKAAQMFSAKGLDVISLTVNNGDEIDIKSIELKGSKTTMKRLKSGKWYLLDDLSAGAAETPAAAAKAKAGTAATAEGGALKLRIGEIKATGENSFHYADATVTPAADINIIIDAFSITDIDSTSPSATPNKFTLKARVGKYGKIDSSGSLRPMSTPPVADLKLKVDGLDLKIASPMLAGAIGYIVESGSLDLNTTFKIDPKGDMSGENNIKLTQLVLVPGNEEVMAKVNTGLPIPLDSALGLLRNKNHIIEMDIPISGNINDPNVNVSDAIGQAVIGFVGTAVVPILAVSAATTALGPIGWGLILAKMGADQLTKVRLASIEYPAGSSEIPSDAAEQLKKTAAILTENEKLNLRLCPFYTLEDAQAVAAADGGGNPQRSPLATHLEQVTELSQQRANLLKEQLINEYKIEPKRVLTCTPELDDGGSGKPRIEFGV